VAKPLLCVLQILDWADAHRRRTGRWPTAASGPLVGVRGESWHAINRALARGSRSLPGGSSLARLLARDRGKRNRAQAPRLREEQVLLWADRYRHRTGRWPGVGSGPVAEAPGENWKAIASALWAGNRGLHGGDTLRRFLCRHGRQVPDLRGRRPAKSSRQVG
jgi:hypothetical protein